MNAVESLASPQPLKGGYSDCAFGQVHFLANLSREPQGLPLILLNPRSRSCRKLVPFLNPSLQVYIPDIPCLGMSSSIPVGATMFDVAGAIVGFMDSQGIGRAHLFGIHTGGKVAAALAARWPQRVASLMVCGKSHSIVPGQDARNSSMKEQAEKPDSLILRSEGVFFDSESRGGMAPLYEANFAFDLALAIAGCEAPLRILEITSPEEDETYGRQAALLASHAVRSAQVTTAELPQNDATGLDMYAGASRVAGAIRAFIDQVPALSAVPPNAAGGRT